MADEQTQTDTQTTGSDSTATTSAQTETQGTTFTQADVDRIVAERLARERKNQQEEAKKREERAMLDAEARAKAEKEEAEQRAAEAEQRARLASYRADLKGEVVDVEAALKLVDEKHVKDGAVDVKALLKQYPFLAPVRSTGPGAGGVQGTPPADARSSLTAALAADGVKLT